MGRAVAVLPDPPALERRNLLVTDHEGGEVRFCCIHERRTRQYLLIDKTSGQQITAYEDHYPAHKGTCERYARMLSNGELHPR